MKKNKKKRSPLALVYSGKSHKDADKACLDFWRSASDTQRMQAINELIQHVSLIKGIKLNELRLLRTTAVIKRF
jgi:hypothetical protein